MMWYFLVIMSFYVALIIISIPTIYKRFNEVEIEDFSLLVKSESLPTISLIIPVYNMEKEATITVHNALEVDYPVKDIIVVNDGSTDGTLDTLLKEFDCIKTVNIIPPKLTTKKVNQIYQSKTFPAVRIVDKENGGKNDANNVGINVSSSQFFLVIDGDTVLEKDAILRMIRPFFADSNIIGQGGTLRVLNGCKVDKGRIQQVNMPNSMVEGIQVIEYLRAFLYGRLGWNHLGGNLIVSGAFGLFERNHVIEAGGYAVKTLAEDFELTLKLSKYMRKKTKKQCIMFIPDPVAWTYVPNTVKWLGNQRARWHQGLFEVLMKYKDMTFNPRYRLTGLLGVPYMWLGELLEPVFEFLGYVILAIGLSFGIFGWDRVLLFLSIAWGFSTLVTIISVVLEVTTFRRYNRFSQLLKMIVFTIVENFWYRQIYVWWRFRGFGRYFRKSEEW